MQTLPLNWLSDALGIAPDTDASGDFKGISTDTRQEMAGTVFVALLGENSNGHHYVEKAIEKGARGLIVEHPLPQVALPQWVVSDTTLAFGRIAQAYRRRFTIPVIGITGSVGKTSTKEALGTMLNAFYPVLVSSKNYNNQIGVPQTLLQLEPEHRVAVIEMGMRGLGQIDWLAEIAEPTIGLITMIGVTHQELLGSRENIALAKSELYTRLPKDGIAIMPEATELRAVLERRIPEGCRVIRFGVTIDTSVDIRVLPNSLSLSAQGFPSFVVQRGNENFSVHLGVVGTQNIVNVAGVLAVAHALELPFPQAIQALEAWKGAEGRMVVRQGAQNTTLLDDCYNAAPESMRSGLETLNQVAGQGRAVAILGDMRELGDFTEEAHRQVGENVAHSNVQTLITVGGFAKGIAQEALRIGNRSIEWHAFSDSKACAKEVATTIREGDTVLVKGSRAMEMEQIVNALLPKGSE